MIFEGKKYWFCYKCWHGVRTQKLSTAGGLAQTPLRLSAFPGSCSVGPVSCTPKDFILTSKVSLHGLSWFLSGTACFLHIWLYFNSLHIIVEGKGVHCSLCAGPVLYVRSKQIADMAR